MHTAVASCETGLAFHLHPKKELETRRGGQPSGFSFEAGGRMFHPAIFHSMSGTLILIFERYYFIIIISFYLSISWIYWLQDNRILQLNSSKVPHYFFFFAYWVEYLIGFPFHFNKIEVTISFSFLLGQVEREIPSQNTLHVLIEHLLEKWRE